MKQCSHCPCRMVFRYEICLPFNNGKHWRIICWQVGACSLVRLVVCARLWDTDSRVHASLRALWSKCLPWDENVEKNEFLLIAHSLGIVDAPRHFSSTCQVLDALRAYAHHGWALRGVPPSDDMFERLDSLPWASLVVYMDLIQRHADSSSTCYDWCVHHWYRELYRLCGCERSPLFWISLDNT
jgi:hypothetical protein